MPTIQHTSISIPNRRRRYRRQVGDTPIYRAPAACHNHCTTDLGSNAEMRRRFTHAVRSEEHCRCRSIWRVSNQLSFENSAVRWKTEMWGRPALQRGFGASSYFYSPAEPLLHSAVSTTATFTQGSHCVRSLRLIRKKQMLIMNEPESVRDCHLPLQFAAHS